MLENTDLAQSSRHVVLTDNEPVHHGSSLYGYVVVPPDQVRQLDPALIILASIEYQADMASQLVGLGIDPSIILPAYDES